MSQLGRLVSVLTDPATQFTAALATNAALTLNMTPGGGLGKVDGGLASPSVQCRIKGITIASAEALDWEVWFWRSDAFNVSATDPSLDLFAGRHKFTASTDGLRIAGAGLYYYAVNNLDIPYVDVDGTGEMHLMLINRSVASKTAGANGAVQVGLLCDPSLSW